MQTIEIRPTATKPETVIVNGRTHHFYREHYIFGRVDTFRTYDDQPQSHLVVSNGRPMSPREYAENLIPPTIERWDNLQEFAQLPSML